MNLPNRAHHALLQAAIPGEALLSIALPALALLLWAVVMGAVVMRAAGSRCPVSVWWRQLPLALLAGALAGLGAWLLLPPGPVPGLAEFGYALPPERLTQGTVAAGLVATAFAWPLLVLRHRRPAAASGLAA
jgi:hypothetical protein